MNRRKRELEHNELAESINVQYEKLKPYLPRIGMITAAILLGIFAVAFWINSRKQVSETTWREFFFSANRQALTGDARGMEKVAELFPNTDSGRLALMSFADNEFMIGSMNLVRDRDAYTTKLKNAVEQYTKVIEDNDANPFVKRRAMYAMAYTQEGLGQFAKAKNLYQELIDSAPDAPITALAKKGKARLENPETVAIYEAFKQWQPAATDLAPETGPLLPQRPNINFPAAPAAGDGDFEADATQPASADQDKPNPDSTKQDKNQSADPGDDKSDK